MPDEEMLQIVIRKRPRLTIYFRKKPENPRTPYQVQVREMFRRVAEMAKRLSLDDVAKLTGYEIYDREKNLLITPEGEILPKTAALVKHFLSGKAVGRSVKPRKWELVLAKYTGVYRSIVLLRELSESLSYLTRRAR